MGLIRENVEQGTAVPAAVRTPLAVVIPAHNEADNIAGCLESVAAQSQPIRMMVSDNASGDETPRILDRLESSLTFDRRRVEYLPASAHFVQCGRWALESGDEPYLALLAADDRWHPGFAAAATAILDSNPDIGMVFPTFIHLGDGHSRVLDAPRIGQRTATRRRLRAVCMSNTRELANQVYGVFRRDAFRCLMDGWERGGERYGADFAGVLFALGEFRSQPAPDAIAYRAARPGANLTERFGISRPPKGNRVTLLDASRSYISIVFIHDRTVGETISRVFGANRLLVTLAFVAVKAPHWLRPIPSLVAGRLRGRPSWP